MTDDDCDDTNADSTIVSEDGDCDGVRFVDDCDDTDAGSTIVAQDADCDGVLQRKTAMIPMERNRY